MGSWGYTDASNAQDVDGDGDLDPTPWGAATEVKQLDQSRNGVMAAMQWRSGNMEMNLDGLYSKVAIDEKQNQTWFQGLDYSIFSAGNDYAAPGSSFTIIDGAVVAGTQANSFNRMDHVVAQYTEDKTLSAGGLNLAWRGDVWSVVTDLSYSEAKRENIWQAVDLVSFPADHVVRLARLGGADDQRELRCARRDAGAQLEYRCRAVRRSRRSPAMKSPPRR